MPGARGDGGAYLSPGSATSTACRTEELVVLLGEYGPSRVSTIPPRAPHIAIAATATTEGEEPVRHRRSATGPTRPGSMRTRLSPEGARTSRRYLRSTGPGPLGPASPRLHSPAPPTCPHPLSPGPAPSRPGGPPRLLRLSPSAAASALRPTEISRGPIRLPLPSSRENWRFASIQSARPQGPARLRDEGN